MKRLQTLFSTLLVTTALSAQGQIISSFDADADGWTFLDGTASVTVNYNAANGNPGGFVSVTYNSSISTIESWFAPSKFLGSHVARSLGQNFRFNLQQSFAGTGSNAGIAEIRIERSGDVLIYQLPAKPAVAPAWSSYSIKLDETGGWRWSSTTGSLATRSQVIYILSNITSIEIRGTYGANASYTSGLDNVILEQRTLTPAPAVTSLSATSGKPGDVITINGSGFDSNVSSNVVSFGVNASTRGVVQSATTNQLSVVVPEGVVYGPITITNTASGLTSKSTTPFNPVFEGGGRIIPASFKSKFSIATIPNEGWFVGDLDGDGWDDFAVANNNTQDTIAVYRNLGLGGNLSAASFATKISIRMPPLGGSGANGTGLWFVDLDGDGKLDLISSTHTSAFNAAFVTFRNISTPGTIAFEAPEYWAGLTDETPPYFVGDVDGDGRADLVGGEGSSGAGVNLWIAQNISSAGNIEFASSIGYFSATVDGLSSVTMGDLNNDGKPDMIASWFFGDRFSIIQNNSVPGTISMTDVGQILTGQYNRSMRIVDINLDGKNDLLWKRSGGGVYVRLNSDIDGILTDTDFATEIIFTSDLGANGGIAITDFNGDGKLDIASSDDADVGVYESVFSGGAFNTSSLIPAYQVLGAGSGGGGVVISDLNHDGKPDLLVANGSAVTILQNNNVVGPQIAVNTVSPLSGPIGSTVTITGNNFSTISAENHVYFGAVKATVLTASTTELTVTVPPGASYAPVSVRVGELTSRYRLPFVTTFSTGVDFNNTHFAPPVSFTLANANYDIEVGDLNRDGKPDILAEANGGFAFRNTHTSGSISTASLLPDDTLSVNSFINPRLEDFDGDGLLDVASVNGLAHRNTSNVPEISFEPSILTGLGASNMDIADFNNDGKMDFATTADLSGTFDLIVRENRSTVGVFTEGTYASFSQNITYNKPAATGGIVTEDFDGDGLADVAVTNPGSNTISIYRNAGVLKISTSQFASRLDETSGVNPGRIYKGDFDVDGKVDLMIYHGTGANTTMVSIYHNTSTVGNLIFSRFDLTNPSAVTVATIADLDGDGKPEILTVSETGNRFSIFKNIHTGGALTAASFAAPFNTTVTTPRGIATGDLNLDGRPEIILTRAAGLLVVYENLTTLASSQNFITQWNLATTGSGPTQLSFGTATSGVVNYTWQEISPGSATGGGSWNGTTLAITGLPAGSTIRLQIAPNNFQRINVSSGVDEDRLTRVEQWGTTAWTSMQNAFRTCTNLQITATDVPNLSSVTDMSSMFESCRNLNSPSNMGTWNTATVTNMRFMFYDATVFNQDIGAWNTAAVTDMNTMFSEALAFNQDIGSWNTAAVTDMSDMFGYTTAFNQDISGWNTGAVTDMSFMFRGASAFNQDISSWNTAAVTDMRSMFREASAFNQNIGTWNLGAVVDIRFMLDNMGMDCNNYSATLIGWSSNPSTPNGRTLEAIGRQYGTNALAARSSLTTTKGWTIAGDAPSGSVCALVGLPTISSFTPSSGPIGIAVTITGTNFSIIPTNNTVMFNGTTAVVTVSTPTSITTSVPAGATTGAITVTVAGNTATSASVFMVTASPAISITAQPSSAAVCEGTTTTLTTNATGTTSLVYQWQFSPDGIVAYADITSGGGYSNTNSATLSVNTTGSFGAGRYRCRVNGDFASEVISNPATLTLNARPSSPTIASASRCDVGSLALTASGATDGQYRWYTTASGGSPIAGEVNGSFTTPSLTITTNYYVSIDNGTCGSNRTIVTATINQPPAPSATNATLCSTGAATLNASGGSNGQYRWYTAASGGTALPGETNSSLVTPSLSTTTTYFVAVNDGTCESERTPVTATIGSTPPAPVVADVTSCIAGPVVLTATGGSNGQYRWYTTASGGTADATQQNSTFNTPSLTTTTSYFVAINDGTCEGNRTEARARLELLAQPTISPSVAPQNGLIALCGSETVTLTAPAGFNSYVWSNGANTQQIVVNQSGSYSVTVTGALGCVSAASPAATVTITSCTSNQAPVINTASASTAIEGQTTINLATLISDPDNNLDLTTLRIVTPPASGAVAAITNQQLMLDYSGVAFSGRDRLVIEICDNAGSCTQQEITIDVEGDIVVYNGVSPNGDGANDYFQIKYIDVIENTRNNRVRIFNRWGDLVYEVDNYNNQDRAFKGLSKNGGELPSGTYLYKIDFMDGRPQQTGFLVLKR